jgi:hypothetical protein
MPERERDMRCRLLSTLGVLAAVGIALVPAAASAAKPAIYPPGAKPFGHSYGEWSALWWQQALAVSASRHPNPFDADAVPCNLGTRKVNFLVGTTGGSVSRTCTIRTGQAILLPLINGECSQIEGNGTTEAQLRACATGQADNFTALHASVDGRTIAGLSRFRFSSPLFRFRSVSDNPFGIPVTPPGQPSPAVADGYWVMLHPLPPGSHTIEFGGAAPAFGFTTSASYRVVVVRRHP